MQLFDVGMSVAILNQETDKSANPWPRTWDSHTHAEHKAIPQTQQGLYDLYHEKIVEYYPTFLHLQENSTLTWLIW
jgi:hypothetical protein